MNPNVEPGQDFPAPDGSTTSAEFVVALRGLRSWAGLTYRQVEARARANGDVLPYSTLATALRRNSLPRRELVASFVRACGGNQEQLANWLTHYDRLAARGGELAERPSADSVPEKPPVPRVPAPVTETRSLRLPRPIEAISGFVACGGFLLFLFFGPNLVRPPNVHWYTIRTQFGTCLDLTGKDHWGNPLVIEQPCQNDPAPEQRFARETSGGVARIKVYNPATRGSTWCLDVGAWRQLRLSGCVDGSRSQLFRLEPLRGTWRLRPLKWDGCFQLWDRGATMRRALRVAACADKRGQQFSFVPA